MAHKPGTRRVLVPISSAEWLALRRRQRHTGKSIAGQLGELLRRPLRRVLRDDGHLELSPPDDAAPAADRI